MASMAMPATRNNYTLDGTIDGQSLSTIANAQFTGSIPLSSILNGRGAALLGGLPQATTPTPAVASDINTDFNLNLQDAINASVRNTLDSSKQVAQDNQDAIESGASTMVANGGNFGDVGRQFASAQGTATAVNQQQLALAAAQAGNSGLQTLSQGLQNNAQQIAAQVSQDLDESTQEISDALDGLIADAKQGLIYLDQSKTAQLLQLQQQVNLIKAGIANNTIDDTKRHTILNAVIAGVETLAGVALQAVPGVGTVVGGALIVDGVKRGADATK